MSKGDHLEFEGIILEACGGGKYRIQVNGTGNIIMAQLSGKMKRNHIRVIPCDRVRVEVSPYDPTNGLIVFRSKLPG